MRTIRGELFPTEADADPLNVVCPLCGETGPCVRFSLFGVKRYSRYPHHARVKKAREGVFHG